MSGTDQSNAMDLVAAELAEVVPPWDAVDLDDERVAHLSTSTENVTVALRSLSALLSFMANHGGDVRRAEEGMPELVDAYWIAWRDDLIAAMPRLSDLTWPRIAAWAKEFEPSWIELSWREPPQQFIDAVAWMWCDGVVRSNSEVLLNWLIEVFDGRSDHPLLADFFGMLSSYAPKVGNFGGYLVYVIGRVGKNQSIPHLQRLADSPEISPELRKIVQEEIELRERYAL